MREFYHVRDFCKIKRDFLLPERLSVHRRVQFRRSRRDLSQRKRDVPQRNGNPVVFHHSLARKREFKFHTTQILLGFIGDVVRSRIRRVSELIRPGRTNLTFHLRNVCRRITRGSTRRPFFYLVVHIGQLKGVRSVRSLTPKRYVHSIRTLRNDLGNYSESGQIRHVLAVEIQTKIIVFVQLKGKRILCSLKRISLFVILCGRIAEIIVIVPIVIIAPIAPGNITIPRIRSRRGFLIPNRKLNVAVVRSLRRIHHIKSHAEESSTVQLSVIFVK